MKRITKLSLVASLALSTSVYANSISDAFANSKVKGEIKAAYVDSNFLGSTESDSVTAIGGNLGIVTGDYKGLKAGATFQTSSVLSDDIKNTPTSKRTNYFDASGAVMSEAYLEYTLSNTSLKAGRQFIYTPLVSSGLDGKSSEAIIKDSFEAYVLTNTDLPDTTIVAAYVNKWQAQSDSAGNVGEFNDVEDGAYTLYLKNNSIENLTLQAQYAEVNGTTSANDAGLLYFQADYKWGPQTISAQYLKSSKGAKGDNGTIYGLKATGPLGLGKLGYLVAYNTSSDDATTAPFINTGLGEGATDTLFTAMPVHDGGVPSRRDTDTLVGALVLPVEPVTLIGYGGKSSTDNGVLGDVTAYGAMAIYPISKNLLLKANYEHVEVEALPEDTDTTRIYLSYKF